MGQLVQVTGGTGVLEAVELLLVLDEVEGSGLAGGVRVWVPVGPVGSGSVTSLGALEAVGLLPAVTMAEPALVRSTEPWEAL